MGGVVAPQQREHGLPFIRHGAAKDRGHRALAVQIYHQHLVAIQCRRHRQMRAGRGLADAALEVGDGGDLGGQAFRAVGQVFLGLGADGGEMGAQAQHLIQREPFRTGLGFRAALRQIGVGFQHPAEMRGRDRDQIFGDFPGRKLPQHLAAFGVHPPAGQIIAAPRAGRGDLGKACRAGDRAKVVQRALGRDVEIRRLGLGVFCHSAPCAVICAVSGNIPLFSGYGSREQISWRFHGGFACFATGLPGMGGRCDVSAVLFIC